MKMCDNGVSPSGKEVITMTRAEILERIHQIETSDEYAERSEAGDDTLWYQIEALYDELSASEEEC